jgi:hypothetical protein
MQGPAQTAPAKSTAPQAGAPSYTMAKHRLTRPNSDL